MRGQVAGSDYAPTMATHQLELAGGVATVTLDRPDALNALTRDSRRGLAEELRSLGQRSDVRAVVLTGAGRAFCAGQDLREEGALDDVEATIVDTYIPVIEAIQELPGPVIAAINGPAAGAGLSFALACDWRVMADDAVLMMAFSNIGLVPDSGGSWLLPRLVGYERAFELAATGRRVQADEASAIGLVQQVVPRDDVVTTAQALAAALAARPPLAVAWTKRLMREALSATLAETMRSEARVQADAVATADHAEGVRAFVEKRAPRFEGR